MAGKGLFGETGVLDFVLLDELSENALYNNLVQRYKSDFIYTYIGEVVVSVNPYKKMDKMFNKEKMEGYKRRYMYEVPPHVYSLSNDVYRRMLQDKSNQCVIISGESGAGKTEASKILMSYIAFVSKSSKEVDRVKNQLLDSNPLLEAFGNAKTLRNDNSSRFGKYMEVQFAFDGAPIGGRITNYLLEKVRVVKRNKGERSFHIFYQMLAGLKPAELQKYSLVNDTNKYTYLSHSECSKVPGVDDVADFAAVQKALTTLAFPEATKNAMWALLSAILNLGNLVYQDAGSGKPANITNPHSVSTVSALLQVDNATLSHVLTHRSITTGQVKKESRINIPLDLASAVYTRDSLAKAIYERVFTAIVEHINGQLTTSETKYLVIGVLDIYGFEVFESNSFEQFCINLCNEKLQQLFIELTLKQEQEEYVREGIQWEPVQYFNNKIIVDLIEQKPIGIIALMDECGLIADLTDKDLLDKMNTAFGTHPHYVSWKTGKDKQLSDKQFKLKHYAGDVIYSVDGFLDKNKDTLFTDLINCMNSSKIQFLADLFPQLDINEKKRPLTAGTQFKNALATLMEKLLACTPHYIRCIKPNEEKKPGEINEERTRHQIRYLGLLENVRVRRAGFAFRQEYERFLWRYKMVCKDTWPRATDGRSSAPKILASLNVGAEEYRLGKTKVFIRNPVTLFKLEEAREKVLPDLLSGIQNAFRAWQGRRLFEEQRAAIKIQKMWRGYRDQTGWIRVKSAIKIQLAYRRFRANQWLWEMVNIFKNVRQDPNFGRDVKWPVPNHLFEKGANQLKKGWKQWWGKSKVKALTKEQQVEMRQKILTFDLLHGHKFWLCSRKFEADYLLTIDLTRPKYEVALRTLFGKYGDQEILFSDIVGKVNSGMKTDNRAIIVTDKSVYKLHPEKFSYKPFEVPVAEIKEVVFSPFEDTFIFIIAKEPYRDMVLDMGWSGVERYSELAVVLYSQYLKLTGNPLPIRFAQGVEFNNARTPKKPVGHVTNCTFAKNSNPKEMGSIFKPVKGNNAQVLFSVQPRVRSPTVRGRGPASPTQQ